MRYKSLANFHAKPINRYLSEVDNLAPKIAQHTILMISFPDNIEVNHWKKEIQTWLTRLRELNRLKTPSGKIGEAQLYNNLYSDNLGYLEFIKNSILDALSKEYMSKDSIDLSDGSLGNYQISLSSIYRDYVEYVEYRIDLSELQSRMDKYYLYNE